MYMELKDTCIFFVHGISNSNSNSNVQQFDR